MLSPKALRSRVQKICPPETSEYDVCLLAILGRTGYSGYPRIRRLTAQALQTSPAAGAIYWAFRRLSGDGLVRSVQRNSAPCMLVTLTPRGESLFTQMFDRSPAPNELAQLRATQTREICHIAWCITMREYAQRAGYKVVLPTDATLGAGTDLLFHLDRRRVQVAVVHRSLRRYLDDVGHLHRMQDPQRYVALAAPDESIRRDCRRYFEHRGVTGWLTDVEYLDSTQPRMPRDFWAESVRGADADDY